MSEQGSLPILLVILDDMADRPYRCLGGRTPLQAAHTPVMDALARGEQSGFYYPLGPGRISSTELAHSASSATGITRSPDGRAWRPSVMGAPRTRGRR